MTLEDRLEDVSSRLQELINKMGQLMEFVGKTVSPAQVIELYQNDPAGLGDYLGMVTGHDIWVGLDHNEFVFRGPIVWDVIEQHDLGFRGKPPNGRLYFHKKLPPGARKEIDRLLGAGLVGRIEE
jgi:hypothetical protein